MLGPLFKNRQDEGDRNYVALLSLKLLLLAFFIMLNAMSSFEEDKARAVLQSVNSTFSGDASELERHATFESALGDLDDKAKLIAEIERLFESTIPAVEREQGSAQSYLRLRLPTESMFIGDETELASGRELLLKRIVASLNGYAAGGGFFEFEFLYGVSREQSTKTIPNLELLLIRSGIVAEEIQNAGLPADKFAIGLQPESDGSVYFVIRVYDSEIKSITFESYQGAG
ncbi:flagellar motor protein MotB [Kiloniella antarctica]|uniref:Flagellar motor protein MotB n=1 Tax=Kiloniella antarctica TaxID=1550907 RepID=A0ABW5BP73_9PROT